MEAIREVVEIKSRKLLFTLPPDFHERKVEMILLPLTQCDEPTTEKSKLRNVRGALREYANSNLLESEKQLGWMRLRRSMRLIDKMSQDKYFANKILNRR